MPKTLDVMYSSKSNEWATPIEFYKELDNEFHFNLDPCSDDTNYKCEKHFTLADDGLSQNWGGTESFVIRLIQILASGLKRHSGKDTKTIRLLLC
jgi:site-specific DNA-methyltransferase (adenine-specific)